MLHRAFSRCVCCRGDRTVMVNVEPWDVVSIVCRRCNRGACGRREITENNTLIPSIWACRSRDGQKIQPDRDGRM